MNQTPSKPPAGVGPDQNPLLYQTEQANEALVRSFCCAMGHFVLHERTEIYTGRDGHRDWEFNVTGLLWIPAGRIRRWRDDSLPGTRQVFSV